METKLGSGARIGWLIGIVGALVGLLASLAVFLAQPGRVETVPLSPRLDTAGPYLILGTPAAGKTYAEAIRLAKALHPAALQDVLEDSQPSTMLAVLKKHRPRYVLIFILPEELDVHFAWDWFVAASQVDDDPFIDVSTGFITGESPAAAKALLERTRDALAGRLLLPGKVIDNLGPNTMVAAEAWQQMPGSFLLPVFAGKMGTETISHGSRAFSSARFSAMGGAGLIHYGGHGYPDRVVDSLNGPSVRHLVLSPNVFFNGACYTGVTGRWFDVTGGRIREKWVRPEHSFALGVLANNSLAYLAALHPDHGIPVYQEMEYLAWQGASLGDVMRHTHNGVILANGGKVPVFERLADRMPVPAWAPAEVMLKGTAARLLFGDPALMLMSPVSPPPFRTQIDPVGQNTLLLTAEVAAPLLKATYADTYFSDLSRTGQFNDRAWMSFELPQGWDRVGRVKVEEAVDAGKAAIPFRLIGHVVEQEGAVFRLHVQVDLASSAYLEGPMRKEGGKIRLRVDKDS